MQAPRERDRLVVEIHAPDRLMRIGDAVGGKTTTLEVEVPEALRGSRWFLRVHASSGADFAGDDPELFHRPTVAASLWLRGIPARLAPSWGQWFEAE